MTDNRSTETRAAARVAAMSAAAPRVDAQGKPLPGVAPVEFRYGANGIIESIQPAEEEQ